MSISYTEATEEELLKNITVYGIREYVHAKLEPPISNRLPFPSDYEFTSCFLPKKYVQVADRILNFDVRPDDVWVTSFPKSGSTWLSNIVWQLQHNLDFTANFLASDYMVLVPAIFYCENDENKNDRLFQEKKFEAYHQLDKLDTALSPRLIKSHFPAHFLPNGVWTVKPKLIYVHRNVKDVCVSLFHMIRKYKLTAYQGSMEDCFDSFLSDCIMYAPFHSHVKSYQQLNFLDNVLILTYEEMLANPFAEIKRISEFLNFTYSDEQLKRLVERMSFENMKKNVPPALESFYRKGKANAYRDEMSAECIRKFDEWEREHL